MSWCPACLKISPHFALTCSAAIRRLDPGGHDILRRLGGGPDPDQGSGLPSSLGQLPLVGRERHRRALQEAFTAVTEGRTVILRVHGPSGAGKSILVQRYLDDLVESEEAVVLAGRCYQQESVPYKALDAAVDMLARYLTNLPPAEVPRPCCHAMLWRWPGSSQPCGASRRSPRHSPGGRGPRPPRVAATAQFAALRDLLARLGDHRPLVLSIDDAQWGDLDSATLLAEVLRPPDPPALLLVASYRSEDQDTSPFVRALGGPAGQPGDAVQRRELLVEA